MKRALIALIILALGGLAPAWGKSDPRAIMQEVRQNLEACDEILALTMILEDERGQSSERKLELWQANRVKGGDLVYVRFVAPRQMKGVQLLTLGEQQWFKLPGFRTRRIAMTDRGNSFAQTEFFYEDLDAWAVEDYTYELVHEDDQLAIIEATPKKPSVYGKLRLTIEKAKRSITSTEYSDRQGRKWKVESRTKFVQVAPKVWRANELTMKNLLTGRVTRATIERREVGPIPASKFSPNLIE